MGATVPCPGAGEFTASESAMVCPLCHAEVPADQSSDRPWQVPPHECPADLFACALCGDTGKRSYTIPPSGESRTLPSGTVISDGGGSGTLACACVRDLPPVEGEATWWTSESAHSDVFVGCMPDTVFELSASAEVPRRADGRRVVMRGNRYWPTWIDLDGPVHAHLEPREARALAGALVAAADACDAVDGPCRDLCGHWWPCSCTAEAVAQAVAPLLTRTPTGALA
jgi:hypothetical protein